MIPPVAVYSGGGDQGCRGRLEVRSMFSGLKTAWVQIPCLLLAVCDVAQILCLPHSVIIKMKLVDVKELSM